MKNKKVYLRIKKLLCIVFCLCLVSEPNITFAASGYAVSIKGNSKTTNTTKKKTKNNTRTKQLSKKSKKTYSTTKKNSTVSLSVYFADDKDIYTTTTVTRTTKKSYKKGSRKYKIKTTTKTVDKIKTINYCRSGKPKIDIYKNILPNQVITRFNDLNFLMEINNKKCKSMGKNVVGLFSPSNHKVYMSYWADCVALHELGHFVDYAYLCDSADNIYISDEPDFEKIYSKEKKKHINWRGEIVTNNLSPCEYFAESFMAYYYSPSTRKGIKKNCPKTYEFIKKIDNGKILL